MHKISAALLISALMPTWGFAQTRPTIDDRNGTFTNAIQLPAGSVRERINRELFRLAPVPPAVRQPERERSWPVRHPVLFGALVGLGGGLAVQAAVIPGASGGEPHTAYLPMFGGLGAAVGSLVGLIASRR